MFLHSAAEGRPSLPTPRMDASTYQNLKRKYTELLWTCFPNAVSIGAAIEAPEKTDYGDIDIIIIDDGSEVNWPKVATELGAAAWVDRGTEAKPSCSLAVYLDGTCSSDAPVKYVLTTDSDPLKRKPSTELDINEYAQIDLMKIGSELRDWTVLYSSYGDLAGILGMVVTNYGFDITEMGLRLRLQEWDDSGHGEWQHFKPQLSEGKMMLSTDPDETLEFFGLSVERYKAGFRTVDDIFQWMSDCRLISRYSLKRQRHVPVTREEKKLTRAMFNTFFAEWLPAHLDGREAATSPSKSTIEETLGPSLSQLRQKYLEEALIFFGKEKQDQYNALHQNILHKRTLETAEAKLKPIIAVHSGKTKHALAELVRAFRRNVEFRDGQPCILPNAKRDSQSLLHTFLDATGRELQDSEAVGAWIKVNFDSVKDVERKREKKRAGMVQDLDQVYHRLRDLVQTLAPDGAGYDGEVSEDVRHAEIDKVQQEFGDVLQRCRGTKG